MNCSPSFLANAARCFKSCVAQGEVQAIKSFLLCSMVNKGGLGMNLVPSGAAYAGGGTYTLNVLANTTYDITWGVNDTSVNICGTVYTSPGAGANTVVYTGSCTTMVFTGTGGSVVTARVVLSPGRMPIPTGFTFTLSGSNAIASWNPPPSQVLSTQVWTSTDNVTYSLAATVAAPGTSATLTGPTPGTTLYCKIAWCAVFCGQFTAPLSVPLAVVSNWATRVVANGGALPSKNSVAAQDTFWRAMISAGIDSKMYCVNCVAPDSLIAMATPLIVGGGSDPWTANAGPFQAGNLSGLNGFKPNNSPGTVSSISSGWNPKVSGTNLTTGNGGHTLYASFLEAGVGAHVPIMGGTDGATFLYQDPVDATANPPGIAAGTYGPNQITGQWPANHVNYGGYYSVNRTSTTVIAIYYANSTNVHGALPGSIPSGVANASLPPNITMDCAGYNSNGAHTVGDGTNGLNVFSYFSFHDGLTQAQSLSQFNAVQALRTAFGGGFV